MTKESHCIGVVANQFGVFTIWYGDRDLLLSARGPSGVLELGTPPVVLSGTLLSYAGEVLQHMLEEENG